jgi:hypothetical protein
MIEFLGQGTAEGIGIGAGATTILAAIGLLVKRGIHARGQIDVGGGSEGTPSVPLRAVCPAHDQFAKLLDERNAHANASHAETQTALAAIFTKLDIIGKWMLEHTQ